MFVYNGFIFFLKHGLKKNIVIVYQIFHFYSLCIAWENHNEILHYNLHSKY